MFIVRTFFGVELIMNILVYAGRDQKWIPVFKSLGVEAKQVVFEETEVIKTIDEKQEILIAGEGLFEFDGILWRIGNIQPFKYHLQTLYTLNLCSIPMLNSAACSIQCYDKLLMLSALKKAGLSLIPMELYSNARMLSQSPPFLPCVVKIGSYHAGLNKFLVEDERQWLDLRSVIRTMEQYIAVEPFIDVNEDIRLLRIGEEVFGLSRKGWTWKSNEFLKSHYFFNPRDDLKEMIYKASKAVDAEVCALDLLLDYENHIYVLELIDVPDLNLFPKAYEKVANLMIERAKR
jgi:glutathione synthase/RimK-type ligase-like ATP-grasp enzyme